MRWIKKGFIFTADMNYDWMQTHAQAPTVDVLASGRLRIYFGTRDRENRTLTTYIEVAADDPQKILYVHDRPILPLGKLGAFDDNGVMPSWIISRGRRKYFFYLGWNKSCSVPYRIANGLAISEDDGQTFEKISDGPIMDRTIVDPYSVSNQTVLIDGSLWKGWYMSFTGWEIIDGRPEPFYEIKYAESKDGIRWETNGHVCIALRPPDEGGIARPSILKENGLYRMWYSYRGLRNYRTDKKHSYRIGYAESYDGLNWTRMDDHAGIEVSENGWDSEMIAYPFVYSYGRRLQMIYNGNGFGKSGFGYAVLDDQYLRKETIQ